MEQIRFYNTGVQLKDNRTNIAGTIHGTQGVDFSNSINIFDYSDIGRSSRKDFEGISSFSIDIERVIGNYSNLGNMFGPFLHHIFSISDTKFSRATGPISYKNSFLPLNLGYSSTGNILTDIKDFDLRIAVKDSEYTSKTDSPEYDLLFKKCLVKNIDYSIEVGGALKEKISLESKIRISPISAEFSKSQVTLPNIKTERINLVRHHNFDKINSVLPTFLNDLCNDSFFVDGSIVNGLQSINISLNIDYSTPIDTGNIMGSSDNENVNLFKFVKLPLDISIKFGIIAQKEIPEILLNDGNFGLSKIIIVFQCSNYNPAINTPNYLVFHLGKRNRLHNIFKSGGSTSGDPVSYDFEYKNINNDFCCYFTNNTNFSLIEESTEKF